MSNTHYDAFISYRHRPIDTKVASELQKQLERFKIPKSIQKKYGKKRFERIFRDQAELEITYDLALEIDEALRNSDFLIVVCSPDYLESKWCLHEIEVFLQTHDRSRVLTVLANGEPPAVFPPILLTSYEQVRLDDGTIVTKTSAVEPLACDYRGDIKKANKTELPRLACCMIGCSYDELVMRQQQYKRKRNTAIFSALFVLAAGFSIYLLYSNALIRKHYRAALISESKTLAKQSLEAYDDRDRFEALTYALQALPGETDRPVTSEAVYALIKASEAYSVPYQTFETAIFDGKEDFVSYTLAFDDRYLVALDTSSNVWVYDLKRENGDNLFSLFTLHAKETTPDLVVSSAGYLISVYEGTVTAYDLKGKVQWEQTVMTDLGNRILESPNGTYLGCTDSYAVQVMHSKDGTPEASFRLPETIDGYIKNFVWAKDTSKLAVQIAMEDQTTKFGIFDFYTGAFTLIDGTYDTLDTFAFVDSGELVITAYELSSATYPLTDSSEYRFSQELTVTAVSGEGKVLFSHKVPYESYSSQTFIQSMPYLDGSMILVAAETHFSIFDPAGGDMLMQRDVGDTIIGIIQADYDRMIMMTRDGYQVSSWLQSGETVSTKVFAPGGSSVAIKSGETIEQNRYYLLKDGDILLFENYYDKDLMLYEDEGFAESPENCLFYENLLLVKVGTQIRGYDVTTKELLYVDKYPVYKTIRLLGVIGDSDMAAVLVIDMKSGAVSVAKIRMTDGEIESTLTLSTTDYYFDKGLLDRYAASYGNARSYDLKRTLLESQYIFPCWITMEGQHLYYHGYEDPDHILCMDLLSGEEEEIEMNLPKNCTLMNGSFEGSLSPLFVSPDETMIYTVVMENGHNLRGALIDLSNGDMIVLDDSESPSGLTGWWNAGSDALALMTGQMIQIYQKDGELKTSIPYEGSKPLFLGWLQDGTLIACYSDGSLIQYDLTGSILNTVEMSYSSLDYVMTASFSMEETDQFIIIICQDTVEMIDKTMWGTRPVVSCRHQALGYSSKTDEVIVFTYEYLQENRLYHVGAFDRYSSEELVKKGQEQLKGR